MGSLVALAWAVNGSWVVSFPVPGMWASCWFVCFPQAVGFLLGCFCWLCPYVGVEFGYSGLLG